MYKYLYTAIYSAPISLWDLTHLLFQPIARSQNDYFIYIYNVIMIESYTMNYFPL